MRASAPVSPSRATATRPNDEAQSPEALLEEQLGWKLPVSHLVWWVRGLPAPDSKSRLGLDNDSRLATLEQDGWQVEYLSYTEQNGYWLPDLLAARALEAAWAGSRRHLGDQGMAATPAGSMT